MARMIPFLLLVWRNFQKLNAFRFICMFWLTNSLVCWVREIGSEAQKEKKYLKTSVVGEVLEPFCPFDQKLVLTLLPANLS